MASTQTGLNFRYFVFFLDCTSVDSLKREAKHFDKVVSSANVIISLKLYYRSGRSRGEILDIGSI